LTSPFPSITIFQQGNTDATQKDILTVLESFLNGDIASPEVSSKDFGDDNAAFGNGNVEFGDDSADFGDDNVEFGNDNAGAQAEELSHFGRTDLIDSPVKSADLVKKTGVVFDLTFSQSVESSPGLSFEVHSPEKSHVTLMKLNEGREPEKPFTVSNVKPNLQSKVDGEESKSAKQAETGNKADSSNNFLSSANSSNLLDFVISDSELVDPFSSVDSFNANISDYSSFKTRTTDNEPDVSDFSSYKTRALTDTDQQISNESNGTPPSDSENTEKKSFDSYDDNSPEPNPFLDPIPGSSFDENAHSFNPFGADAKPESISPLDIWSNTNTNLQQTTNQPFDFSAESTDLVKVDSASNFADNTEDFFTMQSMENENRSENSVKSDSLSMDSLSISAAHPPAVKSVSLIVECDAHSQADNLAELDESDLFDKMSTPEQLNSGENSPFVNSGISTPYESTSTYHSRTVSESGTVPPNSIQDSGFNAVGEKDHGLPSFNSAEMVERIQKKRASVGQIPETFEPDESDVFDSDMDRMEVNGVPFTPQNSFKEDGESFMRDRSLPSMNNSSIVEKVQRKRDSLGVLMEVDHDEAKEESDGVEDVSEVQVASNPFLDPVTGFDDNSMKVGDGSVAQARFNPFITVEEEKDEQQLDSLDHVPFTPVNSYVERSGGEFLKNRSSFSDPELFDKLQQLEQTSEENVEQGTNPFENFGADDFQDGNQNEVTGSQDVFDIFGAGMSETVTQSENLNPFLDMPGDSNVQIDTSDAQFQNPFGDQFTDAPIFDPMAEIDTRANIEAAYSLAEIEATGIIDEALQTFPDLTNEKVAVEVTPEVMNFEASDWTKQFSGDSGIDSNDSPQQGQ